MKKGENLENIIEALLFVSDKPLPLTTLIEVLEVSKKEVEEAIDKLNIKLRERNAPIKVEKIAGGFELVTLPAYAPYIKKLYKNKLMTRLSRAALEVLAIIAYKQPITKQEVEAIRGVNSDGVYNNLLERKLIKIVGRKDAPGRPILYGTTKEFLQYLGINSLDDLPKIEEIQSILETENIEEKWEENLENVKKQSLFELGMMGEESNNEIPNEEKDKENEEEDIKNRNETN